MSTADWYRSLGASGLRVSPIGLGMMSVGDPALQAWALDERGAEPIVREAAKGGITFFDTANTYSDGESERITGRAATPPVHDSRIAPANSPERARPGRPLIS